MKEKRKLEEEPKLLLKQTYQYLYEILNRNGFTIFLLLVFTYVAYKSNVLLYYLFVLAFYFIYLIGSIIVRRIQYHKTYFAFYDDKLIYYQDGFGKSRQEVSYSEIEYVSYQQKILQKIFGQGDVFIKLKSRNIFRNTIIIYGIPQIEDICEKVNKIVGQNKRNILGGIRKWQN